MNLNERFASWESSNELINDEIDGFLYWYYIRINIFHIIANDKSKLNNVSDSRYKSVLALVRAFIHNTRYGLKPRKSDIFVIACPRRVLKNDKYVAVYTDYLAERENRTIYTAEYGFRGTHREPVYGEKVEWIDRLQLIPALKRIVHGYFSKKMPQVVNDKAKELSTSIKDEFDIDIDETTIAKLIEKNLVTCKYKRPLLEKYIKKISPKLIIYEDHYNQDKMLINEIAKEMKIETIELQHGLLTNHIAYTYDSKACNTVFPDEIWLWGDYWKSMCNIPISDEKKITMGFPYFEKEYEDNRPCKHSGIVIAFLSSCMDEMIDFVKEFASLVKGKQEYQIVYKLHPSEMNSDLTKFDVLREYGETVKIIDTPKVSIYELFAQADIQVSYHSSAIYEGLAYNLDSYILNSSHAAFHSDIIESGIAKLIDTPDELFENILNNNNQNDDKGFKNLFFKDHSLENMRKRIEILCNK